MTDDHVVVMTTTVMTIKTRMLTVAVILMGAMLVVEIFYFSERCIIMLTSIISSFVKDVEFAQYDEICANCRVRIVSVSSFQLKSEAFWHASILKTFSRALA